jgi:nucleoside-diphosphate-sugar epimerase
MRILMLGGTKFFGRQAVDLLIRRGHDVKTFSRGEATSGAKHVVGERGDGKPIIELLQRQQFDCLVDNIAFDAEDVEALSDELTRQSIRYVLTSSFVVYGNEHAAALSAVSESDANLDLDDGSQYHNGKRRSERALLQYVEAFPWISLRPCNVEGPGDPSSRRGFWIDRVSDGQGILVPSDWDWNAPFPTVFANDVASAIALAAESNISGTTYNVAGEIITLTKLIQAIADAMDVPAPAILEAPYSEICALAGTQVRLPIQGKCLLDTSAIRADLGYTHTPMQKWIVETVDWWRRVGETSHFWEQRVGEIRVLDSIAP